MGRALNTHANTNYSHDLMILKNVGKTVIRHAICVPPCVFQLWSELGQQTLIAIHRISSLIAATESSGTQRSGLATSQHAWPYDHSTSSCACTKHATKDNQYKVLQQMSWLLIQQMSSLQKQQMSCLQPKLLTKGFCPAIIMMGWPS